MKVIDLFCGAGGFSEGFRQAGFKIIRGIDNDFLSCQSFLLNHNCRVDCQDIFDPIEITVDNHDIAIIGSPPCPHFSEANRNFYDEPDLRFIKRFLQIINQIKPKYWVMENVVGILDFFPELKPKSHILCANEFGLYHKRKRIFIGKFPHVHKITNNEILYPTPVACDDHVHKSGNNPKPSCLSDMFGFTPTLDVFKKIMGFPYDYIFVGKKKEQIKQIGNAVCPPIARAIAETIKMEVE